jgi:hypothetical protein
MGMTVDRQRYQHSSTHAVRCGCRANMLAATAWRICCPDGGITLRSSMTMDSPAAKKKH